MYDQYESSISPVTIFTVLMRWMCLVREYQLVNIRLEGTKKNS